MLTKLNQREIGRKHGAKNKERELLEKNKKNKKNKSSAEEGRKCLNRLDQICSSTTIGLRNICPLHCTILALLSGSETFVHYTAQFFYPVGENSLSVQPVATRACCLSQREGHKLRLICSCT